MKKSTGKHFVKIERLGPALWNRQGGAISGKKALILGSRMIASTWGFCNVKFGTAWVVTPSLDDPLEVSRHANQMANFDGLLPIRPSEALLAQFRRNHVITTCLQQKSGQCKLDGTDTCVTSETGNAAHQKALFEGVWVEIWEYSVFKEHEDSFMYMMTMDNLDSEEVRGEDELGILSLLRTALTGVGPSTDTVGGPRPKSLEEEAINKVKAFSSAAWNTTELGKMMDAAKNNISRVYYVSAEVPGGRGESESLLRQHELLQEVGHYPRLRTMGAVIFAHLDVLL